MCFSGCHWTPCKFEKHQSLHFAAFPKVLNTQVRARILILKNEVKCLAVTKATGPTKTTKCCLHAVHHLHYISWFNVSNNRRKSMDHWRHENVAKFAVHPTQTKRGSRAGGVELLCVKNTFESSAQTSERKTFNALWFLLHVSCQRCYCMKEVYLQGLWLHVQVVGQVTFVRKVNSTLFCQ